MPSYSIDLEILRLELVLSRGNTWPVWTVNHPSTIVSSVEDGNQQVVIVDISIADNCLIFSNINKNDSETIIEDGQIVRDQTIAINRLWANDILLEQDHIKEIATFYPTYQESNIKYAQENNIVLPEIMHQLKFFYNGDWVFEFNRPFFVWYNHLLMNSLTNFNYWFKQTHLGIADESQLEKLNSILKQLND